jgi:hypothetical protein
MTGPRYMLTPRAWEIVASLCTIDCHETGRSWCIGHTTDLRLASVSGLAT